MKMFIIFIVLFLVLYITLLLKKHRDFEMIQTNLSIFTDDLLLEKYPIIIEDNIVNISELFESIFKFQYVFRKSDCSSFTEKGIIQNKNKFLIFHNTTKDQSIISIKNDIDDVFVDVILRKHKVLIVPYRWYYKNDDNIDKHSLNDFIHRFFHFYFN